MKSADKSMERIVALAKNRGFVFPGSDIYGGLANSWDYGPCGAELKKNIKEAWWKAFVTHNKHNVGIDAAILMNPTVWQASGHLSGFSDPLIDCKECHSRFRADQLIADYLSSQGLPETIDGKPLDAMKDEDFEKFISDKGISCPECGKSNFTSIRKFNLMFKTFIGVTEDNKSEVYLRPETAQGIFVNFRNVQRSTRMKIPFGICQIGKSFRNEITPGNFIFRTREFEQMELEFFCAPGSDLEWFDYWKTFCFDWLKACGLSEQNLRIRDHSPEELSFYSKATSDFEYLFPFGWGELWGIADRTDYDLGKHIEYSKTDLSYFDPATQEKYIPYVIEPSLGVDRMFLSVLCEAYDEEELEGGDIRNVLRFTPAMAPVKIAVLPLSSKLSDQAEKIYELLSKKYACDFDDRQSIGKRYRRQDEIGTPYCVTYDFESPEDNMVTVRERDSMQQERIAIDELSSYFENKFDF